MKADNKLVSNEKLDHTLVYERMLRQVVIDIVTCFLKSIMVDR